MKGKDTALFSKASDEWGTPQWLFDLLNEEFCFHCDAAAIENNTKCPLYMGEPYADALKQMVWCGYSPGDDADYTVNRFWLNPPYSKIGEFMKKAYEESQKGAVVVCLIPARTDTKYWHDYVMKAQEIRFIKGRLKFGDSKTGAPFPSVVVIFDIHRHTLGGPYPDIGPTIEQPRRVPV
jgi:site-specific DNA-methyltransferase (adenine-specific)